MYTQPTKEYNKLPKDIHNLVKGNAIKYTRYKDKLNDIPQNEIVLFRTEIAIAFDRIQRKSTVRDHTAFIRFVEFDPYDSLETLTFDIRDEDRMYISSLNNNSVLLPGDLNLKFRAVHDYFHYLLQQPFDFMGEYKVYQAQKHIHKSKLRRQILYSEIVLQAAYATYFGHFPERQKIVL